MKPWQPNWEEVEVMALVEAKKKYYFTNGCRYN
jgi:hypothetical protein